MSAEVNIIAREEEGALLAPSEAEAEGSVWTVKDGRAQRQPVAVGIRDLLRVEVKSGLAEGDLVIVEGQDKVRPGTKVVATPRADDKLRPLPDTTQPAKTGL
jgi:multidrug efflux pump subunit AcrA (membrane-fusion protein)